MGRLPEGVAAMNVPGWMRKRLNVQNRFLIFSVVCGLVCGLLAVGFHLAIHAVFEGLWSFAVGLGGWKFYSVMVAAPTLAGLIVGLVTTRYMREAIGSGIPQTKEAYYNRSGETRSLVAVLRFLLGTLFIGLGNSLGREGPTVHMSSAVASRLGRWGFRDPERQRAMIPVGMAAGIGAAFNAPLSAITFVFEELLDNFSMKALGSIVFAVVIAAAVSRSILGDDPILSDHLDLHYQTSLWMLVAIPLGAIAGLTGHLFVSTILRVRSIFSKVPRTWAFLNPAIGGLLCGVLGLTAFVLTGQMGEAQNTVFSIGYESVELAFEGKLLIGVVAVLFVFKLLAVIINYSSGGSGGLFSPTLFLGAMVGGIVGLGLVELNSMLAIPGFPEASKVVGGCVLLGMGALFGSVIRCPMTSLLIIFEMTGNYSLILPLMAGNMLSWGIANRLRQMPLYDSLLMQDGVNLRRLPAYRGSQDYQHLPVATIMTHEVVALRKGMTAGECVAKLEDQPRNHRSFPVLDDDEGILGMVSMAELKSAGEEITAESFIQRSADFVIYPDTSIKEAANRMVKEDLRQIPVVSQKEGKRLLGIVTLNDIARQQNEIG